MNNFPETWGQKVYLSKGTCQRGFFACARPQLASLDRNCQRLLLLQAVFQSVALQRHSCMRCQHVADLIDATPYGSLGQVRIARGRLRRLVPQQGSDHL